MIVADESEGFVPAMRPLALLPRGAPAGHDL